MSNLRLKFAVEWIDVHCDEAQPRSFPGNCLLRSLARFSRDMEHLMTRQPAQMYQLWWWNCMRDKDSVELTVGIHADENVCVQVDEY